MSAELGFVLVNESTTVDPAQGFEHLVPVVVVVRFPTVATGGW